MIMENISFKSKVNYLDSQTFNKLAKGELFHSSSPNFCYKKAREFMTYDIRTCTAVCLINTKKKEALGIHYYDSEEYYNNIETFTDKMFKKIKNPDRCIIIGGRNLKNSEFSIPSLNKFIKILSDKVNNVTVFGQHLGTRHEFVQSHINYSSLDDTLNICSEHIKYDKEADRYYLDYVVHDFATLKKTFKKIKIANGDELYINNQLISTEDL